MGKYKFLLIILVIIGIAAIYVYQFGSEDEGLKEISKIEENTSKDNPMDKAVDDLDDKKQEPKEIVEGQNEDRESKGKDKGESPEDHGEEIIEKIVVENAEGEYEPAADFETQINNELDETTDGELDVDDIYSDNNIKYMRSDDQNNVIVDVIFKNPLKPNDIQGENLVFDIFFTTHSYNISERELGKKLEVKINGVKIDEDIQWEPQGIPEGHHVSGKIIIPKKNSDIISSIDLLMNDVAGASQRSFAWKEEELKP